jgi:drug/metabolite transporter (DMT)-like permease
VLPLAGVALGVIAVVAISGSGEHHETGESTRVEGRALAVAIASGIFIGGFLVSMGRVGTGGGLWPLVIARAGGTLVVGTVALVRRTSWRVESSAWPLLISCGVLDSAANLLYLWAVQRAPLSLTATLVSLAPASTVVLAQILLRERLVMAQKAGIALALVAIVLLSRG